MKKALIALLLLPVLSYSQFRTMGDIRNIRDHYSETNEKIKYCTDGNHEKCTIYCNEVVINRHQASWRVVGTYNRTIKFWYSDDPKLQELFEKDGRDVLLKIEIDEVISRRENYIELLFRDGALVFYYSKDISGFNDNMEERFYFSEGELIRYLENTENKTKTVLPEQTAYVKQYAEDMMELFLALDK